MHINSSCDDDLDGVMSGATTSLDLRFWHRNGNKHSTIRHNGYRMVPTHSALLAPRVNCSCLFAGCGFSEEALGCRFWSQHGYRQSYVQHLLI